MLISYNWLQNYFEEKLPEAKKIAGGILFHSFEVESLDKLETFGKEKEDWIFDIKILPDRAHDCLSHWGIAKEISVIFNMKMVKSKEFPWGTPRKVPGEAGETLKIEIQSEKCLRYMGQIVRNIKVGESPEWLKEKLQAIGQKTINNIVDLANFVMFDLGQPIHCFDLDKLESKKIIIRNAKEKEKIITLDRKEIDLDESILVIADEKEPLAIAGIKGGLKAEVDKNTKNIIIEVANFEAITTRKTAKKIGIFTDAVKRYENEISPELCEKAMNIIIDLILELTDGKVEGVVDIYPKKIKQKEISISVDYINKRLGTFFTKEEIENVWRKLNFTYKEKDNKFNILVPFLRIDINEAYDLVEEVGRILGYEKIEEKLPNLNLIPKINEVFSKSFFARNKLLNEGYSEVMTYTFRDKGEVEILASASDKKFLRDNLTDGLKESINLNKINLPLLNMEEIKIFEIGTVFIKNKEEIHVCYGDEKNIIEMTLDKFVSEKVPSFKSEGETSYEMPWECDGASTRNFSAEKYPCISEDISPEQKIFKPWSIYPFIVRDIAVWVPSEVESSQVCKVIKENAGELLIQEPKLFDEFKKDNKISYAYRLVFQSYEKTLTDKEINKIMSKIEEKISFLGWTVR